MESLDDKLVWYIVARSHPAAWNLILRAVPAMSREYVSDEDMKKIKDKWVTSVRPYEGAIIHCLGDLPGPDLEVRGREHSAGGPAISVFVSDLAVFSGHAFMNYGRPHNEKVAAVSVTNAVPLRGQPSTFLTAYYKSGRLFNKNEETPAISYIFEDGLSIKVWAREDSEAARTAGELSRIEVADNANSHGRIHYYIFYCEDSTYDHYQRAVYGHPWPGIHKIDIDYMKSTCGGSPITGAPWALSVNRAAELINEFMDAAVHMYEIGPESIDEKALDLVGYFTGEYTVE